MIWARLGANDRGRSADQELPGGAGCQGPPRRHHREGARGHGRAARGSGFRAASPIPRPAGAGGMVRQRGHGPRGRRREPLRRPDRPGPRRAASGRIRRGPKRETRATTHRTGVERHPRARPGGALRAGAAGRPDGASRQANRARDVRHAQLAGDPALPAPARSRSRAPAREECRGPRLMRVAISLRVEGRDWEDASQYVVEAERLGVDCVWSHESWGYDAVTPLAFVAARTSRIQLGTGIIQAGTRTPALVAMTAMSLASKIGRAHV